MDPHDYEQLKECIKQGVEEALEAHTREDVPRKPMTIYETPDDEAAERTSFIREAVPVLFAKIMGDRSPDPKDVERAWSLAAFLWKYKPDGY